MIDLRSDSLRASFSEKIAIKVRPLVIVPLVGSLPQKH